MRHKPTAEPLTLVFSYEHALYEFTQFCFLQPLERKRAVFAEDGYAGPNLPKSAQAIEHKEVKPNSEAIRSRIGLQIPNADIARMAEDSGYVCFGRRIDEE